MFDLIKDLSQDELFRKKVESFKNLMKIKIYINHNKSFKHIFVIIL